MRLWRSPRCWPPGATNPVQIRWKSHVSFHVSWGRWPSLTSRNRFNPVRSWRASSLSLFQASVTQQHKHTERARECANTPLQTTCTRTLYYYHVNILFFPLPAFRRHMARVMSLRVSLSLTVSVSFYLCMSPFLSRAHAISLVLCWSVYLSPPPPPDTLTLLFSLTFLFSLDPSLWTRM